MKFSLLLLFLLAGCATSMVPPASIPFRVMSFNIRFNNPGDGPDAWPNRKEMVAGMIAGYDADLVGVQEALPAQLKDMERLLPAYRWFGEGRSVERGGEYSAIFYRAERFELLAQETFWLSESPEVAGSRGWDADLPRIVTWGRFRDLKSGDVVYLFNTHLDHRGERAREESAKMIMRKIDQITGETSPAILTGDFNAVPDSPPYRAITEAGERTLSDAFASSRCPHEGPASTWNAFRAIEPDRRIDFIFTNSAVTVLKHAILADMFDGRFPSDHLPVLAEVSIGPPSSPSACGIERR
jgi:endonuclease/exonuclease/phosphatase family metal-dependent hydrolase